ncbi:MAG TPA: efflux RND transporter permease subunit, partial [Anaeromyxobacteraceae bacterium]|nr:efflux RND transporter permease subunit [Anaeromyxobacteraceae bacterium]
LAATIAVVAIFVPVVFMKGVLGKYFLQFGVTLSIAVLLSYVEAVTLAPARCSQMLTTSREGRGRVGRAADRLFERLAAAYGWLLVHGLRRPRTVLVIAVAIFAVSLGVFTRLKSEFVPSQDQSRLMVRLQTAVGSNLDETDRVFRRAESFLMSRPEVTRVFGTVGGGGGASAVNTGTIFATLTAPGERMPQAEFAAVLRKELNSYPGVRAVVQDLSQQGFTAQRGFPIEFSVQGPDWDQLVSLSTGIMEQLRASGAVIDLDSNYDVGMPELAITPDRARCADAGVSVSDVAATINVLVGGARVGKYSSGGRRIDVRAKLLAGQRARPEDISRLHVRNRAGELVPLATLITYQERPALQAITRRDRERAISVFANVAPARSQSEAIQIVEGLSRDLPAGYRVVLGGASVAFRESMSGLFFALLLGIGVAYMILASQFNSLVHPVTVLTILPLSVAGAAFALLVGGYSLNIFSMIGLLLLLGIVKKNSIILVDYANHVRATDGLDARAAMLRAGPVRLRPILMTSVATLMAAIPAALALGPGAEIRAPMAVAVIGGLIVSTTLSLLVVPAFYVTADAGVARLRAAWHRRGGRAGTPPEDAGGAPAPDPRSEPAP